MQLPVGWGYWAYSGFYDTITEPGKEHNIAAPQTYKNVFIFNS